MPDADNQDYIVPLNDPISDNVLPSSNLAQPGAVYRCTAIGHVLEALTGSAKLDADALRSVRVVSRNVVADPDEFSHSLVGPDDPH